MTGIDIVQLISSLGFPIVGCLALGWYIVKKQDEMQKVIDNNTKALMMLVSKEEDKR